MLVNVGPILIAIFAGLFLAEGFPPRLILGSAIAFAGHASSSASRPASGPRKRPRRSGCSCAWRRPSRMPAGVTIQKPVLARVPALTVTAVACWVGTIVTIPFAPGLVDAAATMRADTLGWIVYLGVFPTALAFTTWAFALNRTSAGRLGSTTYLVSPIAILMAWLLLAEAPPALALLGGVLAIGGVIVARSRLRPTLRLRRRPA